MDEEEKENDMAQPMSCWAYLGYTLLFLLPVAGIGFLLAFSASEHNTNRRSFARANLCLFLILTTTILLLLTTGLGLRLIRMTKGG